MIKEPISLEFFEFIVDRQRIYREREAGHPWPWTDDKILQTYKFCNVYRQFDRCTEYLHNTLLPLNLLPVENLFWIIFFRRFNFEGMFETFFGKKFPPRTFNAGWLIWRLDQLKKNNIRLFNDAYTTCQIPFQSATRPRDKHVQIILSMEQIWKKKECEDIVFCRFAKNFHKALQIPGHRIGPFLAYQIMQDYRRTIANIIGFDSFTFVGPGAKPALKWIFGEDDKRTAEDQCRELWGFQPYLFSQVKRKTGKDWFEYASTIDREDKLLSIHNIQACLCEFRKYKNLKDGKGRRRIYRRNP